MNIELGSSIFYINYSFEGEIQDEKLSAQENQQTKIILKQEIEEEALWKMDFDGDLSKEGDGVGVWVSTP